MTVTPPRKSGRCSTSNTGSAPEGDVRASAVVQRLEAVDDRAALKCDLALAVLDVRMRDHPLHGHFQLELNLILQTPRPVQAQIPMISD